MPEYIVGLTHQNLNSHHLKTVLDLGFEIVYVDVDHGEGQDNSRPRPRRGKQGQAVEYRVFANKAAAFIAKQDKPVTMNVIKEFLDWYPSNSTQAKFSKILARKPNVYRNGKRGQLWFSQPFKR